MTMEGRRSFACIRATTISAQMLLSAAIGAIVAARLMERMELADPRFSSGSVCFMAAGYQMCSWAMAVMAVGLLLPAALVGVLIAAGSNSHQARWPAITEFAMGAFGFAWWALFAAVDTGVAVNLRKKTDIREMERGAVWAMAWAETGLYLVTMATAVYSAGGARAFFRSQPPASPISSKLLRAGVPSLPPTV